jgi:hypothetical protein
MVRKERSNRLVCRPMSGLVQQVFRNCYGTRLILSGPYQADKSRYHRLSLRTASSCVTPGAFNLFNAFPSRAKAGVNCSGQGLHATSPQAGPKMSIVLSMAAGPTPIPRNFGRISNRSMISRSHSEASYSSSISSLQSPVSPWNRRLQILPIPYSWELLCWVVGTRSA